MTLGRATGSWARRSMVMAIAMDCGSGSGLPSQSTDRRLMAHEASPREEDAFNPFVFSFDYQLGPVYSVPDGGNDNVTVLDVTGEDT